MNCVAQGRYGACGPRVRRFRDPVITDMGYGLYFTSIPIIKPNIYTHQYSKGLSTLTKTVI